MDDSFTKLNVFAFFLIKASDACALLRKLCSRASANLIKQAPGCHRQNTYGVHVPNFGRLHS